MPNYQEKGIYEGGVVTLGVGLDNNIYISPFILNLYDNNVTGMGETTQTNVAKKIAVTFGLVASINGLGTRDDTKAPTYAINVPAGGGNVWIYYDESKNDIAFSPTALSGVVVFAKIEFAGPATSMASATINTAVASPPNRTEAYTASVSNPQSGKHLYHDGQAFIGGRLNRALANIAIVTELFQEESLSSIGGQFFLTLTTLNDVVDIGNTLILRPTRHFARQSNYSYRVYNTKENLDLGSNKAAERTFNIPANLNGDNIYIVLNRTTGAPSIVLASETGAYNLNTTHYLIARTKGPHNLAGQLTGVTSLADLSFEIVNNAAGLNSVKDQLRTLVSGTYPSGIFKEFQITGSGSTNKIYSPELYGNIAGNLFSIQAGDISLSAPPASGGRQDFVFIQVTKKRTPDIVIEAQIRVIDNVNISLYPDPFSNPIVTCLLDDNTTGNTFTLVNNDYYVSDNPGTSEYFAIPLCIVSRFNTGAYSTSGNQNGGGSPRPDGKTATLINSDEILTTCPVITRRDKKELLDEAIESVMSGKLLSQFAIFSGGGYSKTPLLVETLSGSSPIGVIDGYRRFWSGNPNKEIPMSVAFPKSTAGTTLLYEYAEYTYFNTGNPYITLKIPTTFTDSAEVVVDELGAPKDVKVLWADDGSAVQMTGAWVPTFASGLCSSVTRELDAAHATFTGRPSTTVKIVISFKVRYTEPNTLSKPPLDLYKVQLNTNEGKANYFAVATANNNNLTSYKVLNGANSRTVILGSNHFHDELLVDRSGANIKGHAHALKYVMAGNNLTATAYVLPLTYTVNSTDYPLFEGVYNLLSLLKVLDKNGNEISITYSSYVPSGTPRYEVTLGKRIPVTDPVYFIFGLDGKQVDLDYGSLEISNITLSEQILTETVPSSGKILYVASEGMPNPFEGHVIFGMTSLQNKMSIYVESSVPGGTYEQIPVKASGFNTGLLQIDTEISADEYAALSDRQKGCYVLVGPHYRLVSARPIRFGILRAYNLNTVLTFSYKYNASPFIPFNNVPTKLLDSGILLMSTDGIANEGSSVYSPISERLPVVQDIAVIGSNTPSQTGLHPVNQFAQEGVILAPNRDFVLDQRIALGVYVQEGTGLAAYFSLGLQGSKVVLILYEVRLGQLIVSNPDQAFIAELHNSMRISQ